MIKIIKDIPQQREEIFSQTMKTPDVSGVVADIVNRVRTQGDAALLALTEKFDGAKLTSLRVSEAEIEKGIGRVSVEFLKILQTAAENIREFHLRQKREGFEIRRENGVIVGQKVLPIERAGIYVPGGTAAYPSTVLMDVFINIEQFGICSLQA